MSFFKKKKQVYLAAFCTDFYNSIFNTNFTDVFNEVIFKSIHEADSSFRQIDFKRFDQEILTMRLALFSLAWYHEFHEESSIRNQIFTKEYLINMGHQDIWENIQPYSQAIALSAGHEQSVARITFINLRRMSLGKEFIDSGLDINCIARTLNMFGTDRKILVSTLQYLGKVCCSNLQCQLNKEAKFRLVATLKGFYDGSNQELENIKIIS